MAVEGADVAQMRAAAAQFSKGASTLESSARVLHSAIGTGTQWRGPDADRFRSQWSSESARTLAAAVDALRRGADALRRNADEQERASTVHGGDTAAVSIYKDAPAPAGATGLFEHIENDQKDSDGIRVERVVGPDGETRLIAYFKGLGASDNRTWDRGADVIRGWVDPEITRQIDAALKDCPDGKNTDVMLVGLSEGGYDAQNIAAHSGQLGYHVTNVVTYGCAVTQSDHPGINTVHLNAKDDPAVGLGANAKVWDTPLPNFGALQGQDPSSSNHVFNSTTQFQGLAIHEQGYPQVAEAFDDSNDPRFDAAKESMKKFHGYIDGTYE